MAYVIGEECIKCGACASECPVSCITEGEDTYKIDESVCVECGTCASVCPVDAPKQS
jgi:ferredoxin